jgi:hypothetical protein
MVRFDMPRTHLPAHLQAIADGFQTDIMALLAQSYALLHSFAHLAGLAIYHPLPPHRHLTSIRPYSCTSSLPCFNAAPHLTCSRVYAMLWLCLLSLRKVIEWRAGNQGTPSYPRQGSALTTPLFCYPFTGGGYYPWLCVGPAADAGRFRGMGMVGTGAAVVWQGRALCQGSYPVWL